MRRIVRAEASALEAKIAVRGFRRRHGTRKLSDRNGMLFVTNVHDPVGKINLVAIGVGGFAVGDYEAAIENAAVDRMEGDAHAGVLRRRLEATDFLLMRRIGEVQDDEAVATEGAVATVAAIVKLPGNVDRTMEAGEWRLIGEDFRRHEF